MQAANRVRKLSRRSFLKLSAAALGAYGLSSLNQRVFVEASTGRPFLIGVNYPWIAYGHDFGENGWGHGLVRVVGLRKQLWISCSKNGFFLLRGY
jgi:hypothetical protein